MPMLRAMIGNAFLMTIIVLLLLPYVGPIWVWLLRTVLETVRRL